MTTTVRHVLTDHVASVLPVALPFIESGMEYSNSYNVEHAKLYLAEGKWTLFVAVEEDNAVCGAYVVCFQNEPDHRVAFIVSAAGKGLGSDLLPQLDDLLRAFGATKVKALARESAARLYKRWGFEEVSVMLEKKLWAA